MYRMCVLVFLWLFVGSGLSISWDIAASTGKGLSFYYNGSLSHTEDIPSTNYIASITYDPVYNRVIFSDENDVNMTVSSFDLSTRKITPLFLFTFISTVHTSDPSFAYDPVTQLLFWTELTMTMITNLYVISLKTGSDSLEPGKADDGNILLSVNDWVYSKAVDSCGGFIYWTTRHEIERARFDGTEREFVIDRRYTYRHDAFLGGLVIDQHAQKMYWLESFSYDNRFLESAGLNGENHSTLYTLGNKSYGEVIDFEISKDFIYSMGPNGFWQFPRSLQNNLKPKLFSISNAACRVCRGMLAVNYSIEELTEGNQTCDALNSLIPIDCGHGTQVRGESRCECTQGYIGERCDVSVCQDYCFQGECSVSAEGQPKCRCNAGYSGEKCEVDACHNHCFNNGVCSLNEEGEPVCQCSADYLGVRCDMPVCKDYCFQGVYSISDEGQPTCRCNAGYSGERCEVSACHNLCLNKGICSLNADAQPVCHCTADYDGERCEVPTTHTGIQAVVRQEILRDLHRTRLTIKEELQRTLQFYTDQIDEYKAKV